MTGLDEYHGEKPHADSVRLLYQEVCRSHDAITMFRAKLLGLLPLATGVGVLVLLDPGLMDGNDPPSMLGPIGIFGFAVVLGLFIYELRGVQTCKMLRCRAAMIESELRIPRCQSQYQDRPPAGLAGLVGAEFAAWIVYGAILTSWIYVAGVGLRWWSTFSPVLLVAVYVGVLGVEGGVLVKAFMREKKEK